MGGKLFHGGSARGESLFKKITALEKSNEGAISKLRGGKASATINDLSCERKSGSHRSHSVFPRLGGGKYFGVQERRKKKKRTGPAQGVESGITVLTVRRGETRIYSDNYLCDSTEESAISHGKGGKRVCCLLYLGLKG